MIVPVFRPGAAEAGYSVGISTFLLIMRRLTALLAACLVLPGCATQYQSSGLTGGHRDMAGPGKLELVQFAANGYTSAELAQKYAMYRSAEVAKAKGKSFFIMYSSLLHATHGRPTSIPQVGIMDGKPIATAFLLLLDAPQPGAHETQAVLDDLREVIATGAIPKT